MPASDEEFASVPNLAAILEWVDEKRPDIGGFVRQTMAGAWRKDASCEALLLLLTVGFAAGRAYQRRHPELENDWEFHR